VVTPYYFQKETVLEVAEASKRLGQEFTAEEAAAAIRRMGSGARIEGARIVVSPAEYRNDFLHPVDAVEEVMIGRGMASFPPVMPRDFTVGRLTAAEEFGRLARETLVGLGYQEMIYGYLGSKRDFVERMGLPEEEVLAIANPMTESFEIVRNSILPNLLASEAVSAHAAYPHRIFEAGKVVVRDAADNQGCRTVNCLGLLWADREAGFNDVHAHVLAFFYYMSREATLAAAEDPRFLPGRTAEIRVKGRRVGIMGEVHPRVLEAWGIQMPSAAAELDLDAIRES
jgi:phenylalanyl-tRNA synthetase beta chain